MRWNAPPSTNSEHCWVPGVASTAPVAVGPNLFGSRDRFHGGQFFQGLGSGEDGFRTIRAHYVYCALCSSLLSLLIWQEGPVRGLEAADSRDKGPPVACENTLYTTKVKHSTCKQSRDVLTTRGDLDWQASSNGRKYLSASMKFAFGGAAAPSLGEKQERAGGEMKKKLASATPPAPTTCNHLIKSPCKLHLGG